MKMRSRMRSFCALTAAFLLAWLPAAVGQVITTASLTGTVTTAGDKALSGATVVATYLPTGAVYQGVTKGDGNFAFRGLRPGGPYSVKVVSPGMADYVVGDLFLEIDRGANVSVLMSPESVTQMEKFDVTAGAMDALFDPSKTGSGSALTSEDIRNLPAGDRSINSLARLDPRISSNRDPNDRAISVSGLSNRYNSIQVDGVSASDPFGLNANNTAAERNVVPLNSLEALSINTSPYFSRNAGFVGAQINAVTKSGGNDFKGSAYYTYRGRSVLGGNDTVGTTMGGIDYPLTNFQEQTFGADLGGPIIPRKLFFYLSYEKVDEDRVAPSPARLLDQAVITQITTAATALGFKPGASTPPSANKLKDDNVIAKLDWEINANHRATFRYNNSESSRPTFPGFGTGIAENNFSFDSLWYQQIINNKSYIGQLISRWSDRLNTELSVSQSEYHSEPKNNSRQPAVQIRNIPVAGSSNTAFVTFGTENSRHANVLDVKSTTAELFASFELSPKHTLQAGIQYDKGDVYNLFVQNANGSYDFNSLQDFLNVASNNNGTAFNYRTYIYNQIVPGVEPAAVFSEGNAGLFINDSWRALPNLTFDLGARIDMALIPDDVPYNATFASTFGTVNNATYDGKKIIQPRVGFNWQPEGKYRTTVRGGMGLFYGRMPRVWFSNSYSNTGLNFRTFSSGTTPSVGSGSQAPRVSANPDQQSTQGNSPAMTVAFMDPNFELPSRWKANLAFEREVGFWDLKASAEIEVTVVEKDVFYQNINLVNTRTGPDGRKLYFNNYTTASNGTRLFSTAFTNRTMRLGNTDKGDTRAITFSVERPRKKDGWYWKASYVNTEANEVLFGTSSVAASNWNNRSIFNTNDEEEHTAELEVKDRVIIHVTKDFELFKGHKTTLSLFYEGRSGYPFSLVYTTDVNGDSQTQNDLIYVPLRSGDPLVRFATTTDRDRFYQIVDRFGLVEGKPVSGGSERSPWVNQFDFGIKQEIKLPGWRHRLVLGADILNVGNLLNDKWGLIRGSNQFFVKREGIGSASFDGVANQYVYSNISANLANGVDFNPSLGRGEPAATRWSVLLSARYEF